MHIQKRTTCPVCGSNSLRRIINSEPNDLKGWFVKPEKSFSFREKFTALY